MYACFVFAWPVLLIEDSQFFMYIERSPTQPLQIKTSCRRRAIYPTRELAIFVIYFYIVPIYRYFYRFSKHTHTRTYCKNPLVNLSNIEVFMGL